MARWRNAADGRSVGRPKGASQAARLHVPALGKDSPFPARRALIRTACDALRMALFVLLSVQEVKA